MQASYAADANLDALLDPNYGAWNSSDSENLAMLGTPAGMTPTAVIQATWMKEQIGAVDWVQVAALRNGAELAFRLEWAGETESGELDDTDSFPDAAAIHLPVVPEAPLITMGAPKQPVNAWYWHADTPGGARQVMAEGSAPLTPSIRPVVYGRGSWKEGHRGVVLARPSRVESDSPVVELQPGTEIGFGVAIWGGSNSERAGIKSFTGNRIPLELAAASSGRKP